MSVSLTAPARDIRREIARLQKEIADSIDPEMARLNNMMIDIYNVVLHKRGLPV